jgi:hypothetical protein
MVVEAVRCLLLFRRAACNKCANSGVGSTRSESVVQCNCANCSSCRTHLTSLTNTCATVPDILLLNNNNNNNNNYYYYYYYYYYYHYHFDHRHHHHHQHHYYCTGPIFACNICNLSVFILKHTVEAWPTMMDLCYLVVPGSSLKCRWELDKNVEIQLC